MKKFHSYFAILALFISASLYAQPTETNNTVPPGTRAFKVYNNPSEEKTDQFDISGIGATTITAYNTVDGTTNSYNHTSLITVVLTPAKAGNNFKLNFYSSSSNIREAATSTEGTVNIYYPVDLYDAIRTKLEQSFAAKKKVSVKVIQKPNGYREGTLVF